VKKFVDYVIEGMNNKYSTPSCAKTFQKLCVDHATALSAFAEEIIQKGILLFIDIHINKIVIPNPASTWSVKQHYLLIVDGIGALVEKISDNSECNKCMKRVIQAFALPLIQKIEGI
jgi:hypothetical protein